MTKPPESFALQLRRHRKGVTPVEYVNIQHMVTQGNTTNASQAVQLNTAKGVVFFVHNSPCLSSI